MMEIHMLLADAFGYPSPGLLEELAAGLRQAGKTPAYKGLTAFVKKVGRLSLEDWEELATRTLDLSPAAAPYIGFQVWGESYQRGEFMSKLNRAMREAGVESDGELPDHIVPVLRYLACVQQPIPELIQNFEPAVRRMLDTLRQKDAGNPYLELLDAALQLAPRSDQIAKEA
jgi:nitrate reductase molybdenum cofactor assembly chaperone NarJ/NarW